MKKRNLLALLAVLVVTLCVPARAADCYGTAGRYGMAVICGSAGNCEAIGDCKAIGGCEAIGRYGCYTIQPGDTLWKIAARCGTDARSVLKWNPCLENPDVICPGQTLILPGDSRTCTNGNGANNVTPSTNGNGANNVTPSTNGNGANNAAPSTNGNTTNNAAPSTNGNAANNTANNSTDSGVSAYEKEVVRLVNEVRAQNGLNALTLDTELCRGARAKSQDMADKRYFDHNSPTYGTPFQMMKSFGITYRTAGENIAYGYKTAQSVMDGWMDSSGHRANILNASYTRIGVGYVANGNYWTQWFAG